MFKFNYSKYNLGDLFSGGLIHGKSFLFQKLVPKCPVPYIIHGGAHYWNFTVWGKGASL